MQDDKNTPKDELKFNLLNLKDRSDEFEDLIARIKQAIFSFQTDDYKVKKLKEMKEL